MRKRPSYQRHDCNASFFRIYFFLLLSSSSYYLFNLKSGILIGVKAVFPPFVTSISLSVPVPFVIHHIVSSIQLYHWFKFYFPEYKTKENKNEYRTNNSEYQTKETKI